MTTDRPSTAKPKRITLQDLTDDIAVVQHLVAQMPNCDHETRVRLNVQSQAALSVLNRKIVNHFRIFMVSMMHVRLNLEAPLSLN